MWIAGGALLVAVAVDSLAMIGRQIRVPLIGSIEIVEAVVLVASAGALVLASLDAAHARVNLLFDRLPAHWRLRFGILHAFSAAIFYAALLTGTVWIAADLWTGQEESELLRIPYRPLRVTLTLCFAWLLVHSLLRLGRRRAQ